jgi:hypothetical protein
MNKGLRIAILQLLFPVYIFSQQFENFGVLGKSELDLKACPFEKDANAVILLNEAIAEHDEEYHLIIYHHVRIKILNEKGFAEADISIPFWRKDDFEILDQLEAMITNTNDAGDISTEKLSKHSFYKKKIDERIGAIIFTFPNVKVGSIIEYRYRSLMKNYNGLEDWDFQKRLPVLQSKFTLTVLPNTEFKYQINNSGDFPITKLMEKGSGKIFFEMDEIPSLSDEPYMDAREDYLQKVIFQLSGYTNRYGSKKFMNTWNEVITELLNEKEFGDQLGKNIPATGAFIEETKKLLTAEAKMKAVYEYVQKNMQWNNIYSKYAIDGVKAPWEKKLGTSGEINLILVNLLKDAGLEAYPILVSERFHGKVNTEEPFIDQFNSVFAFVKIGSKKYYLDATDKGLPVQVTPVDILNTTGLIVHKKNGGLVTITNDSLQYSDYLSTNMQLDENGKITGDVNMINSGYSRIANLSKYKEAGEEKYIEKYLGREGLNISGFKMENNANDSLPLEQKFIFSSSLSEKGGYLFIPINLFSEFNTNPFINDHRFSNINFGYKRNINTYTSIHLPVNYTVDALPKPVKMTTPDGDIVFTRNVIYDSENNLITCLFGFGFKRSLYTVEEYPILQEVYKKMFNYLKEPVVLKKK